MCCLSKGLGAPVGSMLGASHELIGAARAERKRFGGAMRQAGIIAAAGIIALEQMVDRLAEDHLRARLLAEAVAERWPSCGLDPSSVRTNCVVFTHPDTAALIAHLAGEGVTAGTVAPRTMRFMTHLDVDDAGIEQVRKAVTAAP
jgi:threonine aldolase